MTNKKKTRTRPKDIYITPPDLLEHPEFKGNDIISDEYIMHTQRSLPTSYLYYERAERQCSKCKFSTYNKPLRKKGKGWYDCKKGLNSRIKRYCFNYVLGKNYIEVDKNKKHHQHNKKCFKQNKCKFYNEAYLK